MNRTRTRRIIVRSAVVLAVVAATAPARAETVDVFAAGSLRNVVADLAGEIGTALNVEINPSFGGSGALRERIEKGEKADLLLSADLGSPRRLDAQGRTMFPTIAFARNRLCIVSRRSAHIDAANFVDRMLQPRTRVKTSTPVVDPAGDYAWLLFNAIDRLRSGSGAVLRAKAEAVTNAIATSASASQSAAGLLSSNRVDIAITYCSGIAALEKEAPGLASFEVPATLDPHPVYGLAVLTDKPAALRLALFLLSEKGQALLAKENLVPLLENGR